MARMGILTATIFLTLDGVYQAPGGPDEDTSSGFELGGWQGAFLDDESGEAIGGGIERLDALLMGRRTYDIFASYWPGRPDPVGTKFDAIPKFVASRTLAEPPSWAGTTIVRDVAREVAELKPRFGEIGMFGSGELIRGLIAEGVLDRLEVYLYPVALGTGKRLFDDVVPSAFRLAQPARTFPSGALGLVYEPAGPPTTGISMDELE